MRRVALRLASAALAFAASSIAVQAADLSGDWQAPITVRNAADEIVMQTEYETIRQSGDAFIATKRTGDAWVPAGKDNLRGIVTGSRFPAEQVCAARGFNGWFWMRVQITILDNDRFRVEGGCSGGAVWKRDRRPRTA